MRTVRRFHIQETGVLYPSENGMVCYYMDVERLEAQCAELESKCAELLDACESALAAMKNNDWNEHDSVFIGLRSAIAKAEGA